jgi:hypothetical protein
MKFFDVDEEKKGDKAEGKQHEERSARGYKKKKVSIGD